MISRIDHNRTYWHTNNKKAHKFSGPYFEYGYGLDLLSDVFYGVFDRKHRLYGFCIRFCNTILENYWVVNDKHLESFKQ